MSYTHLTKEERVKIAAWLESGHDQKAIAGFLGKDPSAVSRELHRNKAGCGYDPKLAEKRARERRIQAKHATRKLLVDAELRAQVVACLKKYWSPQQISGRLKRERKKVAISHETIYQYIYREDPELRRYLRQKKGKYRRRRGTKEREKRREEAKKLRIDVRPRVVEKRSRIGDWEGDTIRGKERTTGILTHAERKTGYLIAEKLEHVTPESVRKAAVRRFRHIPHDKRRTDTLDNGIEFAAYELIERDTDLKIYFAHPYHSWERGTNENTNGLLRQFFPKGTPFATLTTGEIRKAERLINHRPRKRLDYQTPAELFWNRKSIALQA